MTMARVCGLDVLLSVLVVVLSILPYWTEASKSPQRCAAGEWFDKKSELCMECSACPVNQLIRRPCTPLKDTQCGPFYEFSTYLKGSRSGPQGQSKDGEIPEYDYNTSSRDNISSSQNAKQDGERPSEGKSQGADNVVMTVSRYSEDVPSIQDNGEYWKELCFGLIGALSAVLLIVFLYMLITHLKHRQTVCKHNVDQVNSDDTHSRYPTVVYHPTSSSDGLPHLEAELARQEDQSFLQRIFFPRGNDYVHRIAVRDPSPEEEGLPLRVVIPAPAGGVHHLEQPENGAQAATSRDSGICLNIPPSAGSQL